MIRIGLVEDKPFSLKALEEKLSRYNDLHIVFTAKNGFDAIAKLADHKETDLILMDIEMPDMNGIEATGIIKQQYKNIKIVMITIYDDDNYIFDAIQAGADSYILKETKAEKIYETIQDTLNGGAVMSPSIAVKALQLLKINGNVRSDDTTPEIILSDRETEILEQLAKGLTNKRIA